MANNSSSCSRFTEDLIKEILLKLPSRSLARFKSISKEWLFIITNHWPYLSPFVILTHKTSMHRLALFCDGSMMSRPKDLNVQSSIKNIHIDPRYVSIIGSCNGLLCLKAKRIHETFVDVIVWNPAIKEYWCLPTSSLGADFASCQLGFGFHHELKDYKVLQFRCDYKRQIFEAEVFTFSKNSWSKMKNNPWYEDGRFFFAKNNSLVVKGVCYHLLVATDPKLVEDYLALTKNAKILKHHLTATYGTVRLNRLSSFILTFDMGNDTFSKMENGLPYDGQLNMGANLVVYQDLLAMIVRKDEESCFNFEIWAMKNESWTKQFIIHRAGDLLFVGCIWNGEVIILQQNGSGIHCLSYASYLYDPSTQKLNKLPHRTEQFVEAHDYVETEVSICQFKKKKL